MIAQLLPDDELLFSAEAARELGLAIGTFYGYKHHHELPEPDDASIPHRPRWRRSTLIEWRTNRKPHHNQTAIIARSPAEKFWSRVDRRGPDECWPWRPKVNSHGYGSFRVDGKVTKAHRFSFELHKGPIPDGLTVDHACHNQTDCPGWPNCPHRRCVNPAHLEAVSHAENSRRSHLAQQRIAECTGGPGCNQHCPSCHAAAQWRTDERCAAMAATLGDPGQGDRLIGYSEIAELTGVSRFVLYSLRASGNLPTPAVDIKRSCRWRESTIRAWAASRPGKGAWTPMSARQPSPSRLYTSPRTP